MAKQDRQGVRTPVDLERKYSFGATNKSILELQKNMESNNYSSAEMRASIAALAKTVGELQAAMDAMGQEYVLAAVTDADGAWELPDRTYAELQAAWESGKSLAVYIDRYDDERRYYLCMGSAVRDGTAGLLFRWSAGQAAEDVFLGSDGVITVEAVTLALTDAEREEIVQEVVDIINAQTPAAEDGNATEY